AKAADAADSTHDCSPRPLQAYPWISAFSRSDSSPKNFHLYCCIQERCFALFWCLITHLRNPVTYILLFLVFREHKPGPGSVGTDVSSNPWVSTPSVLGDLWLWQVAHNTSRVSPLHKTSWRGPQRKGARCTILAPQSRSSYYSKSLLGYSYNTLPLKLTGAGTYWDFHSFRL